MKCAHASHNWTFAVVALSCPVWFSDETFPVFSIFSGATCFKLTCVSLKKKMLHLLHFLCISSSPELVEGCLCVFFLFSVLLVLVLLVFLLFEARGTKSLAGQCSLYVLYLPPPQLPDGWTDEAPLVQIHGSIQLQKRKDEQKEGVKTTCCAQTAGCKYQTLTLICITEPFNNKFEIWSEIWTKTMNLSSSRPSVCGQQCWLVFSTVHYCGPGESV